MYRVKLLTASKLITLGLFISIAAALAGYLFLRGKPNETAPERPKLQGRVVAVFSNTRYAHEVEGRVRFALTAGTDRTYEDGTHELEQVRLESYGAATARSDVVTADRAKVSDPSDLTKLDAEFISNVLVELSDGLKIKTSYLHYDYTKNIVDTKELVEFEGDGLSGRSTGMNIEAAIERVHLIKDVDVTFKPAKGGGKSGEAPGSGEAGAVKKRDESPEEKAARKARKRARKLARRRGARAAGGKQSTTASVSRLASDKPTRIRSGSAVLDNREHQITLAGGVIVNQGQNEMRANHMVGHVTVGNRIESIQARGDSNLKQADAAEIKSEDMDFFFEEDHQLSRAVASGGAYTRSLGPGALREAQAATIEATFTNAEQGNTLNTIKASDNALIRVHPPAPAVDNKNPTTRELTARQVDLQFYPDGQNIQSAQATDNAVMTVTPVKAERGADKKTIRAPQMNAVFYERGNLMKSFAATGGVKLESEATVANDHEPRIMTSRLMTADFLEETQDLGRVTQEGDFKYVEGDRNATADRATYDGQTEILNLRGKRPMAWDSKARTQADEIDYNRQKDETRASGDVRTTYYSRETTGDATPFKNTKSPIFITADRATARNGEGEAVYTGNARGWQDDSFVKADRIELYQKEKRMVAIDNVESALYTVKREQPEGKSDPLPGFATARRMTYSDTDRLVHYDGHVRARQGQDRIAAESIDVYLKKETNEVDRLLAEGSVVMEQPGRRGVGDKLIYTAEDEKAVLTGKNARVEDREKGTTMGAQLTFYNRDDKIFVDNQQGTGRVRSTHRLPKSGK
ncbi:MAG TPA: LPS export ABC transporter periplasmic protein LptC [Blastocatellia bacterium]|nr:LPS export ABC transporter periplasmic protein LptC [Blastocatellia bacterium]